MQIKPKTPKPPFNGLEQQTKKHLLASGLSTDTIEAMGIQPMTANDVLKFLEWQHVGPGYKIPYFDLEGKPNGFARVRFIPPLKHPKGGREWRYGQPSETETHAYLPPFIEAERWLGGELLVITEGEKKAAKAAQEGLLCVGLGGVRNWINHRVKIKAENVVEEDSEGYIVLDIKDTKELQKVVMQANEELLLLPMEYRQVVICFDSDGLSGCSAQVQGAAFQLASWLEEHFTGISVQQVILPSKGEKVGLDDFLLKHSVEDFLNLPRLEVLPHDPRSWLVHELDHSKIATSRIRRASNVTARLMHRNGKVFRNTNSQTFYYFQDGNKELHQFDCPDPHIMSNSFGHLIRMTSGLDRVDQRVIPDALDKIIHARQVQEVTPRRACWATNRALYVSLNDSLMAKVSPEGIEIVDNGTDGVMMLKDQVKPIDLPRFRAALGAEKAGKRTGGQGSQQASTPTPMLSSPTSFWVNTIDQMKNICPLNGLSIEETKVLLACMCYLNPWFRRFRGLQLPLEMASAEPNAGKTFFYGLRRGVLTGRTGLDHNPVDLRAFNAAVSGAPGMWICDNLDRLSKEVGERFSDDLCRWITNDEPMVEIAKLYRTNVMAKFPVDCTFAITCIKDILYRPDILQRSLAWRFKALEFGDRDSAWLEGRMKERERWLADQCVVSCRFLSLVQSEWETCEEKLPRSNRLKHFERCLYLMGTALGYREEMLRIVTRLQNVVQTAIASNNPVIECLKHWADRKRSRGEIGKAHAASSAQIIKELSMDMEHEGWTHVQVLSSAVKLGKSIDHHEHDIRAICGIVKFNRHNQNFYEVLSVERVG